MTTTRPQIGWQGWSQPEQVTILRDLGTVDISTTVAVNARGDERQTPMIVLTLTLDDASMLAGLLDDEGGWPATVTEIRKALGLAGCWVDFRGGVA